MQVNFENALEVVSCKRHFSKCASSTIGTQNTLIKNILSHFKDISKINMYLKCPFYVSNAYLGALKYLIMIVLLYFILRKLRFFFQGKLQMEVR